MNFQFDETQQSVVQVVKDFAERELAPHIEFIEENDHLPGNAEFFKKAGDAGLLGLSFAEEYGGVGLSCETQIIAHEELSKVCPGATIALATSLAGMEIILKHGTEEQKQKYLPACVAGELVSGMAFTEPGTGSDPKQLTTVARDEGDYYVLNGVKRFITNAAYPGPCTFYCRDEDDGKCTAYIVDKFCEGCSLSSEWDKIGFKGSPVYDVFLDNVKVPKCNRIGAKGDGFKILLSESAVGKMVHGAISLGIMEACQHLAIKYANEKIHRNQPITKFPAIQMKIADICMYTESMRYMAYRCGQLADVDTMSEEFKSYAAMTKTYAAETASKVALLAMNILGSYGPMKEYSVERYMRDSLVEPHIEVVSDVQRLITARYFIEQEK